MYSHKLAAKTAGNMPNQQKPQKLLNSQGVLPPLWANHLGASLAFITLFILHNFLLRAENSQGKCLPDCPFSRGNAADDYVQTAHNL